MKGCSACAVRFAVVLQGQQRVRAPVRGAANPAGSSPTSGGSHGAHQVLMSPPAAGSPRWDKKMKPEACLPKNIQRNLPNEHSRKTENYKEERGKSWHSSPFPSLGNIQVSSQKERIIFNEKSPLQWPSCIAFLSKDLRYTASWLIWQ